MSKTAKTEKLVWVGRASDSAHPKKEIHNKTSIKSIPLLEPFFVYKIPLWKRTMDIIGAILGLILFSPLMLLISLLIKIVSSGPILFKQKRVGYAGKAIDILKFRTMKVNANISNHQFHISHLLENDQPMKKLDNDPQIIPFGRILRNACLDELPQLINVLRGEMSLVGPRPDVFYAAEKYETWHHARFNSIPGLTGLWQVSGKNRTTYREMIRLDIVYKKQMSLWLDLKILLLTLPAIIIQIKDNFFRKELRSSEEESPHESDAIETLL
jgi:lipopolysaccharide/colanic/teichoic acid biosynthesis glycosyltransferase